ncbi:MAG: hypothetical protein M0Q13_11335 [Methanothrix sp.]|jgi:hypothetical protein|nr:hypothetical protein [Methanothrix sp.]
MHKEYKLDFEYFCKQYLDLIGFELGKKIRKYFENLGVDFQKLEENRTIICYIPDNIKCIDKNFIDGFIGDRIKKNGINIFLKYNVFCNNSYISRTIYESIKELLN